MKKILPSTILPIICLLLFTISFRLTENNFLFAKETSPSSDLLEDFDPETSFLGNLPEKNEASYSANIFENSEISDYIPKTLASLGLPEVKILPTSPFYPLKKFIEDVLFFLTLSPEKKAELTLEQAEKRLAETYRLIEEREFEKAKETLALYNEKVSEVTNQIEKIKKLDKEDILNLIRQLETSTVKQQSLVTFWEERSGKTSRLVGEVKGMSVTAVEDTIESLVENNVNSPSYGLTQIITNILQSSDYDPEVKNSLETKMNEKIRQEIRKEELKQGSPSAGLQDLINEN